VPGQRDLLAHSNPANLDWPRDGNDDTREIPLPPQPLHKRKNVRFAHAELVLGK
jgi:hypothetical protein